MGSNLLSNELIKNIIIELKKKKSQYGLSIDAKKAIDQAIVILNQEKHSNLSVNKLINDLEKKLGSKRLSEIKKILHASAESKSTKTLLKKLHALPDVKIKNKNEYNWIKEKMGGTKSGGWYQRSEKSLSKGSQWLFKEGGGYDSATTDNPIITNEVYAIREAYAGELYQLFLPNNTPKTRLVVNQDNQPNIAKFQIASKELPHFVTLQDLKNTNKEFNFDLNNTEIIKKFSPIVTKVVITSLLLSERDLKEANFGFSFTGSNKTKPLDFFKIDHGESLISDEKGNVFGSHSQIFIDAKHLYDPAYLSFVSSIPAEYFTEENVNTAILELLSVNNHDLTHIAQKYESLLTRYRELKTEEDPAYGRKWGSLIGNEENAIINNIHDHLNLLAQAYQEKNYRDELEPEKDPETSRMKKT